MHGNLSTRPPPEKDLVRILDVSESLPASSVAQVRPQNKVAADETEDAEDTVTTLSILEPARDGENDEDRLEREEQAAMSKQRRKQKK